MQFLTDIIDVGILVPNNATRADILKALYSNLNYSDKQNEYCKDCIHAEMCSWYGTIGCEWKNKKRRTNNGQNSRNNDKRV